MPKLIALKPMGRLRPGDPFEVNRTQARALKALKRAEDAPAPAEPRSDPTRDAVQAGAAELGLSVDPHSGLVRQGEDEASARTRRFRPRYGRRDMRAEE